LGEANAIGEMLTEQIDSRASVIWGARVNPTFDNKVEIITVFTGVKSPFINKGKQSSGSSLGRSNAAPARGGSSDFDLKYI
jgi:cell division protein FtsZ